MKQKSEAPLAVAEQIRVMGERIRVARVRRRMSQDDLARACGISRTTLVRMEAGSPRATLGAMFTVLWILGLLPTAEGVADPDTDEHGKTLEAARAAKRVRRSRRTADDNDF
jgi:DNA-binding XRE family transcriptional regulator